jgi:hypothetical protein
MDVLLYYLPGFLSLSRELVHLAADVGWYVVTMPKDRHQAAHGRPDALHAQVLIVQSRAVV